MTASLAVSTSISPPPAPAGAEWIDLATAEQRSSKAGRTLRWLCASRWAALGVAKMETPPGGGKPAWLVRDDADPSLARVQFPDRIRFDQRQITEKQRRELAERERILKDWQRARVAAATIEEGTDQFLQLLKLKTGRELSADTLYGWQRRYREGGIGGLADGRWMSSRADDGEGQPPHQMFVDYVLAQWLQVNQRKLRRCYLRALHVAAEQEWATCSYGTCHRASKKVSRAEVALRRGGAKAYTDESEPHIERDYLKLRSNEQWCGDSHRFDVLVDLGGGKTGRPWLTALMDMRSRKIVAWRIFAHAPNEDTIIATFAAGMRAFGVPEVAYLDNGADWTSRALMGNTKRERREAKRNADYLPWGGIFGELGVRVVNAQPYHGQSKPIERQFRTVADEFSREWETYCGNSTSNKPFDLEKRLKRGEAPTLDQLREGFKLWLETEYHREPHTGQGMNKQSPDQVYVDNLAVKRAASDALLSVLLMKVSKPVKVRQNGVTHRGLRYGQRVPDLLRRQGEEVVLRVPDDLSFVDVWTIDQKFIVRAPANERLPANATQQQLREAIGEKRRASKALKGYFKARRHLQDDLIDVMKRRAAAAKAGDARPSPDQPPTSIRPVQSNLSDQLPAMQRAAERAKQLRPAAGAESLSLPLAFNYTSPTGDSSDTNSSSALDSLGDYLQRHGGRASEDDQ